MGREYLDPDNDSRVDKQLGIIAVAVGLAFAFLTVSAGLSLMKAWGVF